MKRNSSSSSSSSSTTSSTSSTSKRPRPTPHQYPPSFYLSTIKNVKDPSNISLSIQDVFSGNYHHAIICNFRIDHLWLVEQVPRLKQIPVICVEDLGNTERHSTPSEFFDVNFIKHTPNMPSAYGCLHTKMAILQYEQAIRIAVFTNNFIEQDWTCKSQGIWIQDFPRWKKGEFEAIQQAKENPFSSHDTFFGPVLSRYLTRLGTDKYQIDQKLENNTEIKTTWSSIIRRYDYRQARAALIPSVPGKFKDEALNLYGQMRLRKLQREFQSISNNTTSTSSTSSKTTTTSPFSPATKNVLCAQVSSIGSLTEVFLNEMKASLLGDELFSKDLTRLTIAWPSQLSVRNSNQGWDAGKSICMPLRNYKGFLLGAKGIPPSKHQTKSYLVQWRPVIPRGLGMPHIKTYCAEPINGIVPWVVLTSANMSKAAWGKLGKNQTQLNILSFEMGVLIRPELLANKIIFSATPEHQILGIGHGKRISENCCLELLKSDEMMQQQEQSEHSIITPLPHIVSNHQSFVRGEEEQPWMWNTKFTGSDNFGNECDGDFDKNKVEVR